MIKVYHIVSLFLVLLFAFGCTEDQNELERERTTLETFVQTNFPNYYEQRGVFKAFIRNTEGGYDLPEAVPGDEIEFLFIGYYFSGGFDRSTIFYTNIASVINNELVAPPSANGETGGGLGWEEAADWPTDFVKTRLGSRELMEGLKRGLPYSRLGDEFLLFIPSDLAFGELAMTHVPEKSSLVFQIIITSVNKR